MIKLTNLKKHYANASINVINNTTLELPATGLISFIGKSGSGKTTLLNVIGGLDKADSGEIAFDDEIFKKYNMNNIDKYRQKHIGYVFQNYLLIENMSVYNNLKISLDIIGITNHEEQQKRIKYALEAVGMYKYRKKQANKLSGGQMQRVAIARALLKESKVIIADEPTGNLDSDNSVEVMNILKKISEKTLILLVTHNKELANFYSDRIIEIADGNIISDETVDANDQELNINKSNQIHLLDLNNESIKTEGANISLYKDNDERINLRIILKNNTLYIDSDKNIQLSKQTNIKIINDHYKPQEKKAINNYNFDISWYNNNLKTNKFTNIFKNLKTAFVNFFHSRKRAKAFHVIFFFLGIIIAFSTIEACKYRNIDTSKFSKEDAYYLINNNDNYEYYTPYLDETTLLNAIDNDIIEDIYRFSFDTQVTFKYNYNSIRSSTVSFNNYNYPYSLIKDKTLICGTAPKIDQVVIGKELANYILKRIPEISNYEQLINLNIGYYTISGISSTNTNSIYYNSINYYANNFNVGKNSEQTIYSISSIDFEYELKSGTIPLNDNEIMINIDRNNLAIGDIIVDNIQNKEYRVVGLFETTRKYVDAISYDSSLSDYVLNNGEFVKIYYSMSRQLPTSKIDYTLLEGHEITNDKEILVPKYTNISVNSKVSINDKIYTVAGIYELDDQYDYYLTSDKEWNHNLIADSYRLSAYSFHLKDTSKLNDLNLKACKVFNYQYNYNKIIMNESRNIYLIVIVILLVISIVYVYFSTRSKMISEIKEVGVYRSIGATKWQIYSKYLSDIIINSTFTSIIGYLIIIIGSTFISIKLAKITGNIATISVGIYILGAIVLYLINIIFGLLPVFSLMRKTPAEINSKYDI